MSYAFLADSLVHSRAEILASIQASASVCTCCGVEVYCVNRRKDAGKVIFLFLNRAVSSAAAAPVPLLRNFEYIDPVLIARTCPRRAQVLEDWGMDEIALVFKDFRVNKNASVVTGIHIHAKQITGCYWQAVRPYSGSIRDFNDERKRLDDVKSGRCFGDLGKRFKHPYGMKN